MDAGSGWRNPAPNLEESFGPAALREDAEGGRIGVGMRDRFEALRDGGP